MKRFAETMHAGRVATELRAIQKPFPIRLLSMKIISTTIVLYAFATSFVTATLVTFDDLPTPALGGSVVPNGYDGLNWANVYYVSGTHNNFGPSGYNTGVVSPPNIAFMGSDSIGEFVQVSGPTFNFNSARLTAAWRDGLNIRVRGYSGGANGTLLYDRTVIVNTAGPIFFTFNYLGIDTLRFDPSGGTISAGGRHFVIDDMTVTPPGTPLAQDLSIVAAGNLDTPVTLKGTDPRGLPLTFSLAAPPLHGNVYVSGTAPNLTYTYSPFHDYLGPDSFKYVASNGTLTSPPATVNIIVKHGLLINDLNLAEGNSGTKAFTFTVTMTVPTTSEFDMVTFSYRTADGTAKAGSDYVATTGTITVPIGVTSVPIVVPVIGDGTVEFDETFLVQLINNQTTRPPSPTLNAVVVRGTGRGTIKNDDSLPGSRVGTAALIPEDSAVSVGEPVKLSLDWTHPIGWRKLESVDLLLADDEGESLALRWHQAENSFSLFSPAADRFVRTAEAGSRARLETSEATLFLQECTGGGPPGQTVTIDFGLEFKPQAAGRTFSIEALATDDDGNQQGFESVGTITVR